MGVQKIDFKSSTAGESLVQSFSETGFAVITNHDIKNSDLWKAYEDWAHFFRDIGKQDYLFHPKTQTGYFPFKSENAKDSQIKDLKEFYHLYPNSPLPTFIDHEATYKVRQQLLHMATTLLGWIQEHSPAHVRQEYQEPLPSMIQGSDQTLFRILHYPPLTGDFEPGAVRAAPHEDINLITLLPAATQPGLEVATSSGYQAIDCDPGNIIVNVGDMLQLASNGYFRSTTHRVVNPMGEEAQKSRYSMPLFVHPRTEVFLSQTKTAGQYLEERLKELGLK